MKNDWGAAMTTHIPVLLVTHNAVLRQRWQEMRSDQWLPALGASLDDLVRWRQQGRQLAVLDAELPGLASWSNAVWEQHFLDLKVLVLTAKPTDEAGRKVLASGASGYAHSATPLAELNRILSSIADGNIWLGRSLLQRLLRDIDQRIPTSINAWAQGLTHREQEVAYLAATGESNLRIAEHLEITERTVRAHLSSVFEKLQVCDRLMLALKVHGVHVQAQPKASEFK